MPDASPREIDDAEELIALDAHADAEAVEELKSAAGIGVYIAPVVVAHLALVYLLIQAMTGWRLPRWLHSDLVVAWLWVNGAAITVGVLLWRKSRMPFEPGVWIQGRRARQLILAWLGLSLLWFLAPALARDAWNGLRGMLTAW